MFADTETHLKPIGKQNVTGVVVAFLCQKYLIFRVFCAQMA